MPALSIDLPREDHLRMRDIVTARLRVGEKITIKGAMIEALRQWMDEMETRPDAKPTPSSSRVPA